MQNINAMDNNDDNKNMQWQKHVVETILFTGKQYNFSLQTTYSSCLKKKKRIGKMFTFYKNFTWHHNA